MTRWIFYDPQTLVSWTVPRNPNAMSFPTRRRQLDTLPTDRQGRIVTQMAPPQPVDITFSGSFASADHHDQLLAWTQKPRAVILTDHLARGWLLVLSAFEPTFRPGINPYRGTYVVKGYSLT